MCLIDPYKLRDCGKPYWQRDRTARRNETVVMCAISFLGLVCDL